MKISVCLATYNGEKYIAEQLSSILGQLGPSDEVIISDDSSTDSTLEIIGGFNDPRIVIYPERKFRNPIRNFEFAISRATGDIIFLSDQDDIWLDDKVSTTITHHMNGFDLVLSNTFIIDEMGIRDSTFFESNASRTGVFRNLFGTNSYLGCCLSFTREVKEKILPFPTYIPMHDWWIGLVAEFYFKIGFVKKPLMVYRRHEQNATPTAEKSKFGFMKKVSFRINLLRGLLRIWLGSKIKV